MTGKDNCRQPAKVIDAGQPLAKVIPVEDLQAFENTPPWFVTESWQLYDHLKLLLDDPRKIQFYKNNSVYYVNRYCTIEYQRNKLMTLIHSD